MQSKRKEKHENWVEYSLLKKIKCLTSLRRNYSKYVRLLNGRKSNNIQTSPIEQRKNNCCEVNSLITANTYKAVEKLLIDPNK